MGCVDSGLFLEFWCSKFELYFSCSPFRIVKSPDSTFLFALLAQGPKVSSFKEVSIIYVCFVMIPLLSDRLVLISRFNVVPTCQVPLQKVL